MSNNFETRARDILERVEDIDLNQTDAAIAVVYREAVADALQLARAAKAADLEQYTGDTRDYAIIRDAVAGENVARRVFKKVSMRCAGKWHESDSIVMCAERARVSTIALAPF